MANGLGLGSAGVGAFEGLQDLVRRRLEEEQVREQIARSQALSAQGQEGLGIDRSRLDLEQQKIAEDARQFGILEQRLREGQEGSLANTARELDIRSQDVLGNLGLGRGRLKLRAKELEQGRGFRERELGQGDRRLGLEERRITGEEDRGRFIPELRASEIDLNRARTEALLTPQEAENELVKVFGSLSRMPAVDEDAPDGELQLRAMVNDPTAKIELMRRRAIAQGRKEGRDFTVDELAEFVTNGVFETLFPHLATR